VTAGALEFAARGRRATFRDLVLDTAFGTLSGKLNGRRLALAGAFGLSSERKGFAVVIGLRKLKLTRGAAMAMNRSLGIPGLFRAGQRLASATGVCRAEQIPVHDGRTYLDFGDPFFEKLRSLRVNTKPIGNAWVLGTYFAIPDTVGEVALDFASGGVASDDGVALKQFESNAALDLHDFEYDFAAGVVRASIGTRYTLPSEARVTPLARFRVTVTHKNAYTGELSASATGTLTEAFADRLNEAFAEPKGIAPPFAGGDPLTIGFGLQTRR
jgi:hypothetical protein